jgi:hypothetical protein
VRFENPRSIADWIELRDLLSILLRDPGSHVFAAEAGWQRPVSRTEGAIMGLIDLWSSEPIAKPWDKPRVNTKPAASGDQVRAAFAALGY